MEKQNSRMHILAREDKPERIAWLVSYSRIPTDFNDDHAAIVHAETAEDAQELVRRQLGDRLIMDAGGLRNYYVRTPQPYVEPPEIDGEILTMNHQE